MAYLTWTPRYSVNVKRFDGDHQQLFDIINQLHEGMKTGHGKEVLEPVLAQLIRYTEDHFSREEAALKVHGYPRLAAHIEQHRSFVAKMKEVSQRYKTTAVGLSVEVLDFLTQWLAKHIVGTDQQYSTFLNAKGVM